MRLTRSESASSCERENILPATLNTEFLGQRKRLVGPGKREAVVAELRGAHPPNVALAEHDFGVVGGR